MHDHKIGKSVGYRCLHEGIAVLAWQAPDLRNALLAAKAAGYDLWWSAKIHNHGGNVQLVSAPDDGFPLWTSDVRPGREHDITALRASGALPVLAEWTADVLTDLGYEGLRDQVAVPYKKAKGKTLPDGHKQHNRIHNALRAVGERHP